MLLAEIPVLKASAAIRTWAALLPVWPAAAARSTMLCETSSVPDAGY
jgi:hypothetical protein